MDLVEQRYFRGKLFKAIVNKDFKLAKILADGGVDVNISLKTGLTPLMAACDLRVDEEHIRHKRELIKSLLNNKADINQQDIFGATAYTYARRRKGRTSTVTTLQSTFCIHTETDDRFSPIDQSVTSYYRRWNSGEFSVHCSKENSLTRVE